MSLALARKYRPATFEDLIGQESVSQTLSLALESDRLSHAYLFSGLRGSGKTSTARIFAKALLCEKGTTSHPCGVCSSCVMANEGRHVDIIEMDGASNRKIDDIRELIEHTKYKPAIGRYKIFIIDEVHMLTKEAFNALLKTLEEPPAFVKFILATTDPLKLPATILSRTQHFRFRKISQPILERHLEHILNLEKVEYEREAISIIARSGAGSVRDALTLLDQAIVYSKNFVDISTITNMLGIIEPSLIENLVDNILGKDTKAILEFVSISSEFEAEMIIDELSLYLKDLLLSGSHKITPMSIERFFRVLAESKTLLNIGTDGEFVLSLTLFKMMESLSIEDRKQENKIIPKPKPNKEIIEEKPKVLENIEPREEKKEVLVEKPKVEKAIDGGVKLFENLVAKLYDRNYELGQCFESNITYNSFVDNRLTWESVATDNNKKLLINNWSLIRMFVQEIFGLETKIKNIPKE
ncbi:MAG TPA: DNA polymerase III subunit gamma/tau, partial [Campylobacterales bacterium]|nr:DNA polymerase III subunit gamma/tau [Campylobacterales bacterium]